MGRKRRVPRWAQHLFYSLFPAQRRAHEEAERFAKRAAQENKDFDHSLFRRIKDMDPAARRRLQDTQLGPVIEKLAKQEEERRSAHH